MHVITFFRYRNQCLLILLIGIIYLLLSNSPSYSQPLATGHDKFLGNVYGNSGAAANFGNYWNQVTPENSGKWGSAETGRDMYDWYGLDAAYDYALSHDYLYKHHTLVWGQQQPWWLAYLDSANQAEEVEEWIQLVGEKYPDMNFVDVVNEPLRDHNPPSYKNSIGGDGVTGWDWVIWCFEKARQYCADSTKLILNEFNLLNSNYNTDQFIIIVNLLKERDLIDAIGVQCHYFELRNISNDYMKANLDKLAATGLPIYISEFDIDVADDNTQLQEYQRVFPMLWEHPGVKGITFWGYIQNQIWKVNGYLIRTNGTERPALEWLRTYLSGSDVKQPSELIPTDFALFQNYPNPFNPSTTIRYSLRTSSNVRVTIYNVKGAKIQTLVDSFQNMGEHSLDWDAKDDQNNLAPSGIYFYRLEIGVNYLQRKMLLVR